MFVYFETDTLGPGNRSTFRLIRLDIFVYMVL